MNRRVWLFLGGTLVLLVLAGVASNAEQFTATAPDRDEPGRREVLPIERDLRDTVEDDELIEQPQEREPVEVPPWIAYSLAAVAGVGALYLISRQRISLRLRRRAVAFARANRAVVTEEEQADAIGDFAHDLIDELNAADSPRLAIQRAYAAVETGFGAQELARKPAETPLRYLKRIFGRHNQVKAPLERLTALFERARFSDEPMDESKRSEAIAALTEIGDYYKAFAWNKISNIRSKSRA